MELISVRELLEPLLPADIVESAENLRRTPGTGLWGPVFTGRNDEAVEEMANEDSLRGPNAGSSASAVDAVAM